MVKLAEFLLEGLIGTIVVSILPALMILVGRAYERRVNKTRYDSTVLSSLQNHIYEKIVNEKKER